MNTFASVHEVVINMGITSVKEEDFLVIDLHADIPEDISARREKGETHVLETTHLRKFREGGIDAAIFAVWVESEFKPCGALRRGLQIVENVYEELSETNEFVLVTSPFDIVKAKEYGKIAVILGVEGAELIEQDLRLLRIFHRLGLKTLGLVWQQRNIIADGLGERRTRGGLSNFGVDVIKECNRLGIIVDLAHLTEPGFWDVLEATEKPVIVSHTHVQPVARPKESWAGLNDEQIKAIAKNSGIMGICTVTTAKADPPGTVDLVVKEMEYVKRLVGIDCLAFGADYYDFLFPALKIEMPEYDFVLMPGLEDASKTHNLARKMMEKGFSNREIRKILGENFLRLFKEVTS